MPVSSRSNSLIWKGDVKGKFTMKGCYKLQRDLSASIPLWPWKCIWRNKAPLKVECFTWLVAHGACLTHENLQKEGSLCVADVHFVKGRMRILSINHLFIHCSFTKKIWDLFFSILGVNWIAPNTAMELLQCCLAGASKGWKDKSKNLELYSLRSLVGNLERKECKNFWKQSWICK